MHHRALLQTQCFSTGSDRGTGKPYPNGSLENRKFDHHGPPGANGRIWNMCDIPAFAPGGPCSNPSLSQEVRDHHQGRDLLWPVDFTDLRVARL